MAHTANSELGNYLRATREARGVSLAQAAAETRIVQRYLLALEMGEFHHLPGDVYARGFLRNYAQYLELPAEELLEMYRSERGASMPIRVVPASVMPQKRKSMAPTPWAVALIVMALIVLGYVILNALGFTNPTTVADNSPNATPSILAPSPLPTYTPAPTVAGATPSLIISPLDPSPTTTLSVTLTPTAPVVVVVRVVEGSSWMEVTVDGGVVLTGIQYQGWEQTFTAQTQIRVKAGNAAAVEVSFNGGPFNRMSRTPGAVLTQDFAATD